MTDTTPKPGGWIPSDTDTPGGKLHAPAVERNTAPILAALADAIGDTVDPPVRRALEVASGSGQHAIAFAEAFPAIFWQPSERDLAGLASIETWRAEAGHTNLAAPVHVDLGDPDWAETVEGPFDLVVACNVLHIAPWAVAENLVAAAARCLNGAGALFVYGCFSRAGDFVAESNRRFDRALRARDPDWGVRDTDAVAEVAARHGMKIARVVAMPANNTVLVLRHAAHSGSAPGASASPSSS